MPGGIPHCRIGAESVLLKDVQRSANKSAAIWSLKIRIRACFNECFGLAIVVSPCAANRSGDRYRKSKALPDIRPGRTRGSRPTGPHCFYSRRGWPRAILVVTLTSGNEKNKQYNKTDERYEPKQLPPATAASVMKTPCSDTKTWYQ